MPSDGGSMQTLSAKAPSPRLFCGRPTAAHIVHERPSQEDDERERREVQGNDGEAYGSDHEAVGLYASIQTAPRWAMTNATSAATKSRLFGLTTTKPPCQRSSEKQSPSAFDAKCP